MTGLTSDEIAAQQYAAVSARMGKALEARGVAHVEVIDQVSRDAILEKIAATAARASADGEFWLVLLGQTGRARDGAAAFQVRGPRLTDVDLRAALLGIDLPRVVFIGTNNSGAYLEALTIPGCDVLTATAAENEQNRPRLPEFLSLEMERDPRAAPARLAARAVDRLKTSLQNEGISLGEHAQLHDGKTGKILTAPFGVTDGTLANATTGPTPAANRSNGTPVSADQIRVPKIESDELFEHHPATPETLALVRSAAALPNPDGYDALIARREVEVIINKDQSIRENVATRNYLVTRESFDDWANYRFPQLPPGEVTRVKAARLILPDGSSWVLNAEKLNDSARGGVASLLFPQAEPGSLVELESTTDRRASFGLPRFYLERELAEEVPVRQLTVDLKLPKGEAFHWHLGNIAGTPVESATEHSQSLKWEFADIAPYEPLPNDPPRRDVVPWLGVSAFESWDDFSGWFRRIAAGAFEVGPRVKEKAAEIAADNVEREDRIRAAYQYVTGLRYVAIECGLHAFRPRTPEQTLHNRYGDCKDKANLLVALLGEMEIDADFVLINRGSSTDPDFPGWQFNHAIAYLPPPDGTGDGTWLDSTDPSTPYGSVAPGNIYRQALVFETDGKAEFKEVKPRGDALGRMEEEWTFAPEAPGRWTGDVTVIWRGPLAHGSRAAFGDMRPLTRRLQVNALLGASLPLADFTAVATTDPYDLEQPLELTAKVATALPRWPGAPEQLLAPFAAPTRPRALELFDSQPMHFRQVVTVTPPAGAAAFELPEPFEQSLDGQIFTIRYRAAEGGKIERVAECRFDRPRISAEQYPDVRKAVRDWAHALERPIPADAPSATAAATTATQR